MGTEPRSSGKSSPTVKLGTPGLRGRWTRSGSMSRTSRLVGDFVIGRPKLPVRVVVLRGSKEGRREKRAGLRIGRISPSCDLLLILDSRPDDLEKQPQRRTTLRS